MTDKTIADADAATELRELLREAHGATKDLRQAITEARDLARRLAGEAAREVAGSIADACAKAPGQTAGSVSPAALRCPDCTASASLGGELEHDENCPLGLAIDAVAGPGGTDAQWFREHPEAEGFCRKITSAEKAEAKAYGSIAQDWSRTHSEPLPEWVDVAYTRVRVTRINDGNGEMYARAREFLR
jgi:hypothetical protein